MASMSMVFAELGRPAQLYWMRPPAETCSIRGKSILRETTYRSTARDLLEHSFHSKTQVSYVGSCTTVS